LGLSSTQILVRGIFYVVVLLLLKSTPRFGMG
jgi:hypothetical protein